MAAEKPVPVVNLPPVRFLYVPSKQVTTGNIQGAWDSDRSVAVVTAVGAPVEEALVEIVINTRRVVIHLKFNCEK